MARRASGEIREAAAQGLIAQAAAEEMLGDARQTLILQTVSRFVRRSFSQIQVRHFHFIG